MRCCVEYLAVHLWGGRTAASHEQTTGVTSLWSCFPGQWGAGQGDPYLEAVDDEAVASEHSL